LLHDLADSSTLDAKLEDIKKELAEEEHRKIVNGQPPPVDTSPSGFVIEGLAIEATQYVPCYPRVPVLNRVCQTCTPARHKKEGNNGSGD
jgi:hypothetical protein